ncbi:two-component sensor histidine kinase [Cryptosporangium phraense]|uniref:histidine kinase n=2 Tax=Cryptosporangium phraense TaxID=2593070 RepID=A0A545AUD8_9ACTN|nr:two-component sensor histidine kinase [Cryptosporangium phraense]
MLVVQCALAAVLLLRRRAPVAVGWLLAAATAVLAVVEAAAPRSLVSVDTAGDAYPWLPAAAPFAAYAATAFGFRRGLGPAAVLVVLATHFWALPPDSPWLLQGVLFAGGPALLGLYVAARRRLLASLVERTERAERERHLLAEQARAEERSALAAEIHDLVTHRVSLMVLQAGALRISADQPETRAAADEIRETGAQALTELREVIGLLREPPAALLAAAEVGEAPPGRLSALVGESGVQAVLVEDGDPGRVRPVVGRAAYRVVQEALTNVRKHAPGAAATVTLRYRPEGVQVSVRNGPAAAPPDPAVVGSGTGLLGLRERVELLEGSLKAGPCDDGGFLLEARLPA